MRWSEERYVKLYTRDTATWIAMTWQARAVFPLLMRKMDGAGLLECGALGKPIVGLMIGLPEDVTLAGLESLENLGVIAWRGTTLEAPNFLEAQEATKSDVQRKRDQRERARAQVRENVDVSRNVTRGHGESRAVTESHARSRRVTRGPPPSQPSPAQPSSITLPSEEAAKKPLPPADFVLEPELGPRPRKKSEAQEFWEWAQSERERVIGLLTEAEPDAPKLNAWFKRAVGEIGLQRLKVAWAMYVLKPMDDHWLKRGFPFQAFMTDAVWRKYVQPERKTA